MDATLREIFNRYGPTLALIATVVLLVVLLPSNTHGTPTATNSGAGAGIGTGTGTNVATNSGTGAGAGAGNTAGQAAAGASTAGLSNSANATGGPSARGVGSGGSGQLASGAPAGPGAATAAKAAGSTCRNDGREAGFAVYMPPCQPLFTGNNGGATARGVFPDYIKVAYYVPQANAATTAALYAAGVSDQQADVDRIMDVLRHYFNDHYETWGREVRFTKVNASGASNDDVAAKADAQAIAQAGYFAVITAGGTTGNPTFDATVGRLGVICVACSVSESNSFYQATQGYNFGALPTLREYYTSMADFWAKRLVGTDPATGKPRTAKWAGAPPTPAQPDYRTQPRKFGLIWYNANMGTVDPGTQEERDYFVNDILPRYGLKLGDDESYNYDITQGPTEAQTIIAKMHAENITTIACICDPLMPVFFTREATKEQYFPEWFITGTDLIDTTFFGRTYDPQQWAHAFGMSPLWVFWNNIAVSDGYREYHDACPGFNPNYSCSPGSEGIGINTYQNQELELFTGVMMAGPHLTPQTFAQGEYNYPATGGDPAHPLFKYTPTSPVWIKDMTEVWWNPNQQGKAEAGDQTTGGGLMKSMGGKRYQFTSWPTADPYAFSDDQGKSVFTSDAPYMTNYGSTGHSAPDERCLSCKQSGPDTFN